jgi:hypothetical protein
MRRALAIINELCVVLGPWPFRSRERERKKRKRWGEREIEGDM